MRAVVVDRFGGPDVLQLRDVSPPKPRHDELLVAVRACGTNPVDATNRADGSWAKLTAPFIVGYDVAGTVVERGDGVDGFEVGDEVIAMLEFRANPHGAYAELTRVPAGHAVKRPKALAVNAAAALPLASCTALQALNRLAVAGGEHLLIVGAAGGVGSFATQFAAARGARVVAVASAHHHDFLQSLGAETCLDYRNADLVQQVIGTAPAGVDAILNLAPMGVPELLAALRERGRVASVTALNGDFDLAIDRNHTVHGVLVRPDRECLATSVDAATRGELAVPVDDVLPLEKAARAHRRLDDGHGRGKVVLRIEP